jgi:hypothetical protein
MHRRSLTRLWVFATVFTLAFSQVAMAAFTPPAAKPMMERQVVSESPCHDGKGALLKPVCLKSCQDEPQKNEVVALAALPPSPDDGLKVEMPARHEGRSQVAHDASLLARATAPPPHLLFARFLK